MTIKALLRHDRDRLRFWPGSASVDHYLIQRAYRPGETERCVFEAAEQFAELRPCVGFAIEDGYRPEGTAWLTVRGSTIDPAGDSREPSGFLGVELTPGEAARWTPTQPGQVAVSDVHRQRLAV